LLILQYVQSKNSFFYCHNYY